MKMKDRSIKGIIGVSPTVVAVEPQSEISFYADSKGLRKLGKRLLKYAAKMEKKPDEILEITIGGDTMTPE